MSLQTRLTAFVQAVGADIKALKAPKVSGTARGQTDSSIEWIKQSDGSLVARVDSYVSANIQATELLAKQGQAGASKTATSSLVAEEKGVWNEFLGQNVAERTQLSVVQEDPLSSSQDRGAIRLYAGNKSKMLFGSSGYSDFADRIPIVQVLPSTPVDGQEVYFQNQSMMNNGVAWRLRYRMYNVDGSLNTNTDKWEFAGGSAFYARDPAVVTPASGGVSYTGPSHTIVLPGWYEVDTVANAFNGGSASGIPYIGHYNASDTLIEASSENWVQGYMPATSSGRLTLSRCAMMSVRLTAGLLIRCGFGADFANCNFRWRSLGIRPIRVSAA